jgi:prophage maintenance system killer protein
MAAAYLLHLVKNHPFVYGNSGRLLLITIEIYDRLRQKVL